MRNEEWLFCALFPVSGVYAPRAGRWYWRSCGPVEHSSSIRRLRISGVCYVTASCKVRAEWFSINWAGGIACHIDIAAFIARARPYHGNTFLADACKHSMCKVNIPSKGNFHSCSILGLDYPSTAEHPDGCRFVLFTWHS